MITSQKQSWGGFKIFDGDKFLGLIEKIGSKWETNQGETFTTKKLAIESLLPKTQTKNTLKDGWVTVEEIRKIMSDSEFKKLVFEDKIIITQMNLGQPRMGEPIFDNRQFNIKVF